MKAFHQRISSTMWRKKFARYSILTMLGLFFLNFLFKTYTNEIVGTILKEIVYRDSKGLYRLEYEDLDLRILKEQLTVNHLRLIPDSAKMAELIQYDTLTAHNIFEASISEAFIGVKNIPNIYLKKELTVTGIKIINPHFKMLRFTAPEITPKTKKEPFEVADIQEIILENLKKFKINFFKMQNASFEVAHYKQNRLLSSYALHNVSVALDDFNLDSLSGTQKSRAFFTEDLDINIKNYALNLADGIHILYVGEVGVSTGKSELYLDSLHVYPKAHLTAEDSAKGLYEIKIPKLKISGLDFEKAYFKNQISIRDITFEKPSVKILAKTNQDSTQKKDEKIVNKNDLLRSILSYSPSISVNNFHLNQASLDFSMNNKGGAGAVVHDISFVLQNFHLDSTNLESRAKHLYSEHVEATIRNHTFKLPDGIHTLRVGAMGASTLKSEVFAENVHVIPNQSARDLMRNSKVNDFYNLHLPEMRITGIDLWDAYIYSIFDIEKVQITRPDMHFFNRENKLKHTKKSPKKRIKNLDIINLYPLVAPFFKSLKVEHFALDSGTFRNTKFGRGEQKEFKIGNTSLILNYFELNEDAYKNQKKIFYANEIEVFVKSHTFDLPDSIHVLNAGDLFLSTSKSIIRLGASNIESKYKNNTIQGSRYDIAFDQVELSGIDVRDAYFNREYYAKKLLVRNPKITATLHPRSVSSEMNPKKNQKPDFQKHLKAFEIEEVILDSGQLNLVQPETNQVISAEHFQAILKPFRLDSMQLRLQNIVPQTDTIEFEGKNYTLALPKIKHFLTIQKLGISSSRELIYLDSLQIKPLQGSENQFTIILPALYLKGIDVAEITTKHRLSALELELKKPFFDLRINTSQNQNEKKFRLENLYDIFRKSLENMTLHQINIDSARLFWSDKTKSQSLDLPLFSLRGQHFQLSETAKMTNENFVFAKKWELEAQNLTHQSPNSILKAQEIRLTTGKNNEILGKNLHVYSAQDTSNIRPSMFDFRFPNLYATNFDVYRIYAHKDLIIEEIQVEKPVINFVQKKDISLTKKFCLDSMNADILNLLQKNLNIIEINLLKAEDLEFDVKQVFPNEIKIFNYAHIWLKINNFKPKKSLISSKKILFSDDITAKILNYDLMLKDNIYKIRTQEIGFSTQNRQLWIDSLSYAPIYDKYEISKNLNQRTSWLGVHISRLVFDSMNIYQLIENQSILSNLLRINGLHTEIFTEDSYPEPTPTLQKTVNQMIMDIKVRVALDTIQFSEGYFRFSTHPQAKPKAGDFFLNDLHGKVLNFSNDKPAQKHKMHAEIHANILGRGRFKMLGSFDLSSPMQSYRLTGDLQEMDMTILNDFLGTIAPIKLKSGKIRSLQFQIVGDKKQAIGTMLMFYNNLKINVIRKHKFGELLFSFIANNFVLDANNYRFPLHRKAKMYDERKPTETIFAHWISTLLSGAKISLGINDKKVAKNYRKHSKALIEQL